MSYSLATRILVWFDASFDVSDASVEINRIDMKIMIYPCSCYRIGCAHEYQIVIRNYGMVSVC